MKTFAPYKDPYKPQTQDELNSVAQKAASEHTLSKPTGPAKVVDAVATCSLPVSKIEALCIELETDADETDAVAGHQSNGYSRGWHDGFTASLRTVSTRLRELSGLPIKRQPEENVEMSHGAKAKP